MGVKSLPLGPCDRPVAISFGSSNLRWSLLRFRLQVAFSGAFESSRVLTEKDLDPTFSLRHSDILRPGIRGFGFWIWKPQLIVQLMTGLPRGQLVAYLDLGCHVLRTPGFDWTTLYQLCVRSPTEIVVFQDCGKSGQARDKSLERVWTKGDLLDFLNVRNDPSVTGSPQIAATSFVFLAGEKSETFFREWLAIAEARRSNIDDTVSNSPNFPDFQEHRFDQSIFSVLSKIRGSSTLPQDLLQGVTWINGNNESRLPWIAARDTAGFIRSFGITLKIAMSRFLRRQSRVKYAPAKTDRQ